MKVLTFGEIMLRLKAPGHERFFQSPMLEATFGGGEANVAVSLANYGMDAEFLTVLPKNDIAECCIRELRYFGVDTKKIVRGEGRMGIYYLEGGANQLPSKVVYDRAYSSIAMAKPGDIDWDKALGSSVDGDDSSDNFVTWTNAGAINTALDGKIKISFDAYNYRFTVKDNSAPTELYMTGSAYNWGNPAGDPNAWKELVPVNGTKGAFWGIFHFAANDQVKFAPQANWGNDFGFIDAISQESKDLAGLSDEGGNLKVDVAGWYLVYVSVIGDNKVIEFEKPNVYLMGDTSYDGWNAQLVEQDLFTVPGTADGEFVSPAFLKDGAVRICVNPKAVSAGDWWKTEFIIFDGQIAYRGNGGDQAAVQGKTGQKVYLNFGNGTGRIE